MNDIVVKNVSNFFKSIPEDALAPNQKHLIIANMCVSPNPELDLISFCSEHGVNFSSIVSVVRLAQFEKDVLDEAVEKSTDPAEIYRHAVKLSREKTNQVGGRSL